MVLAAVWAWRARHVDRRRFVSVAAGSDGKNGPNLLGASGVPADQWHRTSPSALKHGGKVTSEIEPAGDNNAEFLRSTAWPVGRRAPQELLSGDIFERQVLQSSLRNHCAGHSCWFGGIIHAAMVQELTQNTIK